MKSCIWGTLTLAQWSWEEGTHAGDIVHPQVCAHKCVHIHTDTLLLSGPERYVKTCANNFVDKTSLPFCIVTLQLVILFSLAGKLHPKIIISDLVGFFYESLMMKVWGRNSNRNTVKQMAKNSRVTAQPVLRHWCQASRIRGCWMVLNLTGHNRFTMAGHLRSDSGWSWKFWITHVTLHEGEVAPLTSQTLACAIFFRCMFDCLPVQSSTSDHHHRIQREKKSIRSGLTILECSFPLNYTVLPTWKIKRRSLDTFPKERSMQAVSRAC